MITRQYYMQNSGELFDAYYKQFVTASTLAFVRNNIGIKLLKKSTDEHFNDIIKHGNNGAGRWVWGLTPMDIKKARECGEVSEGYLPSQSCHTCVGKTAARMILKEESEG